MPRSRNRRAISGVIIHSVPGGLPSEEVTAVEGIPATTAARTLLDLAAVEPEVVVERCLDEALRRRIVSLKSLDRLLTDGNRRRGRAMVERLVAARATAGVTDSPLETQVLSVLRDEGLPIPMLQYEVWDGDRFVARPDFAYAEKKVALEADSYRYHGDRQAFDHDRGRGNDLQSLGWLVLRITSKHIEENPRGVAAWVRRALNR